LTLLFDLGDKDEGKAYELHSGMLAVDSAFFILLSGLILLAACSFGKFSVASGASPVADKANIKLAAFMIDLLFDSLVDALRHVKLANLNEKIRFVHEEMKI
jgi:hypothetical protein